MKNYTVPPRKPDMMDEMIEEKRPDTKIRAAKSPKPEGSSRMRLLDYSKANRYGLQST